MPPQVLRTLARANRPETRNTQMNPNQVRPADGNKKPTQSKPQTLSLSDSLSLDLPGIQGAANWTLHDWAGYLYDALAFIDLSIRVMVFPHVECPCRLIDLNDALELAADAVAKPDRDPADYLGISSPCLAARRGYEPRQAFVHSCFAIYNLRALLLEKLHGKMKDLVADVYLAEALALAERVVTIEGVLTESVDSELLRLATQSRANHIRSHYTAA